MRWVDKLLDGLTYLDLVGRRRPRRYVLAAIAIFALIGGIVFLGWRQRGQHLALGLSAPTDAIPAGQLAGPAPASTEVALAETQLSSTTVLPVEPSATANSLSQSPTLEVCPTDPAAWQLEKLAGSSLGRIAPECAYAGLARTVAWELLAESMGYVGTEAAQQLGFTHLPFEPIARMAVPVEKGLFEMGLHLNFAYFEGRSWILTADLQPALTYFLHGCFRPHTPQGYPVVCSVGRDVEKAGSYMEVQGHRFGWVGTPEEAAQYHTRRFVLFGYQGAGRWAYLGIQNQPEVQLILLGGDPREWRARQAGLHGVEVWDAAWVERTFGYSMQPLPEGWQAHIDPKDAQAAARILSDYLQLRWEKGADRP